jgi:hypothetical protein
MEYGAEEQDTKQVKTGVGEVTTDVQSIVSNLIEDAVKYVDEELTPARAKATQYYNGDKFGNETPGRSQVVLTEVRDAIDSVMPEYLRLFFGPDHAVEFEPVGAEDVEHAKQATDAIRYVFERDNPGFMIAYSTLKDGLMRQIGAVKWGTEPGEAKAFKVSNVSEEQLANFVAQEEAGELEIVKITRVEGEPLVTIEGKRTAEPRIWVEAMPCEELLFTKGVKPGLKGIFVGHRTERTRGELIALGVSAKDLDEHGDSDYRLKDNEERIAREGEYNQDDPQAGEANKKITYVEGYALIDEDGDDVAELRQICTIGPGYWIVKDEPTDYVRMAAWCPNPEAHSIKGLSDADNTMDMQLIKSLLFRSSLDSLGFAIYPRTAYQEGQVSVEDVLNTEIGAPIRTRSMPSNVLQVFSHTWVGKEALGALDYCDSIIEKRTGRDQGAMGIDADALQSTTKDGVNAAVQSSQLRIELKARLFAEMLLKPMFKGLLKEFVSNQPRKKMMRLRNNWVEIDPSTWNVDMDVIVNVALGSSLKEEKLQVLAEIKATQESILSQLGPQNPLVKLSQYYHTLKTGLEIGGFKDVGNFFTEVPADWQPPAPPEPQPTPEQVLAQTQLQIEEMKTKRELAIKEAELTLKEQEADQQHEREMLKLAQQLEIEKLKLEMEYNVKLQIARINAEVKQSAAVLDGQVKAATLEHDAEIADREDDREERRMAHEKEMDVRGQAHEEHMAERQQDHAEKTAKDSSE